MDEAVVDSDILSELIKARNPRVSDAARRRYQNHHRRLAFSAITLYEISRGFLSAGSIGRLAKFVQFAARSDVIPVSIRILERAAQLWADAYRNGHPRGDTDIIIAATALETNRVLVTGNTTHFNWIPGLTVADWRSGSP